MIPKIPRSTSGFVHVCQQWELKFTRVPRYVVGTYTGNYLVNRHSKGDRNREGKKAEANFTGTFVEQNDIMPLMMFLRPFSGPRDLFNSMLAASVLIDTPRGGLHSPRELM